MLSPIVVLALPVRTQLVLLQNRGQELQVPGPLELVYFEGRRPHPYRNPYEEGHTRIGIHIERYMFKYFCTIL